MTNLHSSTRCESYMISHFKRRISLEEPKAQKQGRFLCGTQIAHLIYENFRVTTANDSVGKLCRRSHYWSPKWFYSRIRFEMGRNSVVFDENPACYHLGRIVQVKNTKVSEIKTVLELYDLEIYQKKLGPHYHRLKTMVKRSIEQEIRNKNFGAKNVNFEKKRRDQESAWT